MTEKKRIAIIEGSGFIPGMNAVLMGAAKAAGGLGWDLVGIHDGLDGILYPERYDGGGLVELDCQTVGRLDPTGPSIISQSPRVDPFHVREIDEDNIVQEVDYSDRVIERFKEEKIDALVSVTSGRGLTIMYKLHRKGLPCICIPRSVENEVAATDVSFGFNTALSFTIEMLDRTAQAARSARQVGVVEVLGKEAGWLALQSAIAASADAVLIPELPYSITALASELKKKVNSDRPHGLVVVAAGANCTDDSTAGEQTSQMRSSLSPSTVGDVSEHVIQPSGGVAKFVANELQRHLAMDTYPIELGNWARCGTPTAVDRQLALLYGVGAIMALKNGHGSHMVAFRPPDTRYVELVETINDVRTISPESELLQIARALGICLGGGVK